MGNWSITTPCTLSTDTEPTIVIAFDSAKYIFNAGENTTRAFLQSQRRWNKTRAVFLTSVGTQRATGLPGLLMSMADGGVDKLDICGPQGLIHLIAAMRAYTVRHNLSTAVVEALPPQPEPHSIFEDKNMKVFALPIHPTPSNTLQPNLNKPVREENQKLSELLGSLKRKRSPSPPSTSKRPVTQDGPSNSMSESPPRTRPPPSLHELLRQSTFDPRTLNAADAQEWCLRLIQERMFSGSSPSKASKSKAGKGNPDLHKEVDDTLAAADVPPASGRTPHPNGFYKQLPPLRLGGPPPVVAYVIEATRQRGKFDVKKAEAMGLVRGPLRAKVAQGQTVTITVDDGKGGKEERTIRPEDLVAPSEPPPVAIILDVPTTAYVTPLVASFSNSPFFANLKSHDAQARNEHVLHAVFHICGEGVLEDKAYKNFMNEFPPDVNHFVTSRKHGSDPVTFTSAGFSQLRLNQLDAEMFPLPHFNLAPTTDLCSLDGYPPNTSMLRSNLMLEMRPRRPPSYIQSAEEADRFHPAMRDPDGVVLPEATKTLFASAQADVASESARAPKPGDDVRVIPLGTSSASPSKYRNVSGTLVQIPKWGNVLLDAGEGSWGQLGRFFGRGTSTTEDKSVWGMLRELRCIFISHAHGDHHIGLAKILAMRKQLDPAPTTPLYLVGTHPVLRGLYEHSDLEDLGLSDTEPGGVRTVLSEVLRYNRTPQVFPRSSSEFWARESRSEDYADELRDALGLKSFTTVDVDHRVRCFGAVMRHRDGWSIVFSGDTQPCQNLVDGGKDATLLIHEATMADDQTALARAKAHSTIGEAIEIGQRMNAQNILLTHFSARYPKMPPTSALPAGRTLAIALDHAALRIGDMWKMERYLGAIEQSFEDTAESGDADADIDPAMEQ